MLKDYLIVHRSILPDYYDKVLEVRRLMESGKVKEVSQAVKQVGISRSTYYKYKDYIYEPSSMSEGRKAVLSMMLNHEPGTLSALLTRISDAGFSVLTITQSLPIHNRASVTISLEMSLESTPLNQLLSSIEELSGVENVRLQDFE